MSESIEIERLRQALSDILNYAPLDPDDYEDGVRDIAKRALEERVE